MDYSEDKKLKSQKRIGLPYITAEDILNVGKNNFKEESPINLSFDIMKEVRMSPIEWENFDITPKLMKMSNSGTTAILSAKWNGPRPYLANGPMSGKYVFSQLHFHWGRSFQEGSEHRVNGESLPLEMHAMFFKNIYICQDDAMKRLDGIITLAYFFHLQEEDNVNLNPITDVLPNIAVPLTSQHVKPVPLCTILPPFSDDYFLYWGNVINMNVLWLICRKPLSISSKQLMLFQSMIGSDRKIIDKNFREPRDLNNRMVFHVNPSENKAHPLLPLKYGETNKSPAVHKVYSVTTIYPNGQNQAVYTVAEIDSKINEKSDNYDYTSQCVESPRIGDIILKNDSIADLLKSSLRKKQDVKDLKYTLAKMLLELEKKEGNDDLGVLENYLKVKYKGIHEKHQLEKRNTEENKGINPQENEEFHGRVNDITTFQETEINESRKFSNDLNRLHEKCDIIEEDIISKTLQEVKNKKYPDNTYDNDRDHNKNNIIHQQSGTISTTENSTCSERSSNKRRCRSASENRNILQLQPMSINKFGVKTKEVLSMQESWLVRGCGQQSVSEQQWGNKINENTRMYKIKGNITLDGNKSDEFSLLTSEIMSTDSESNRPVSSKITSSEEVIRQREHSMGTKKKYDIQALREKLHNRRLKRNQSINKAIENERKVNSPKSEEDANKNDNVSIDSKVTGYEERSRKQAIRQSVVRMQNDRSVTKGALLRKPKTPDRPAWKP